MGIIASRELKVEIIGDSKSLQKALGSATDTSSKFGSAMKTMGKVAVGVGAAVTTGFAYTLKRGFDELAESQKVAAQTEAVIKSTGAAAGVSAKQVETLAESLSKKSGVDDEVIQSSENVLLTFTNVRNEVGRGNDIFNQATGTILDMSVALGTDMQSATIQVGKALNDPIKGITALQRVGVSFTEAQKDQIKALVESGKTLEAQKVIVGELTKEFGGSAEAAGKTLPGQLNKLRNAFDEVAGNLAAKFLPALTKIVAFVNENWPQIERAFDVVGDALVAGLGEAVNQVRTHFNTIKSVALAAFDGIRTAVEKVIDFFKTDFGQTVAGAIVSMVAFKVALAKIGVSVGQLGSALGLLTKSPFFALLVPLGLLIGEVTSNFVSQKIAAAQLAAAYDKVAGSAASLRDAQDRLKQAGISLERAQLSEKRTNEELRVAQIAYNKSVDEFGPKSAQAKAAHDRLTDAKINEKQADLDLTEAQKARTRAQQENTNELNKGANELFKLVGFAQKANDTFAQSQTLETFTERTRRAGQEAAVTARKLQDTAPAAARAQEKVALLADVAVDLANKLGRVPSKKEIIAEAKLRGKAKFEGDIDGVVQKMKNAASGAGAAGEAIGSSFGSGISSGIRAYIQPAIDAAQTIILAAEAAARRAAGNPSSPAPLTIPLGQSLVEGVIEGVKRYKGRLAQVMGIDVKESVAVAKAIAAAAKEVGWKIALETARGFVEGSESQADLYRAKIKERVAMDAAVAAASKTYGKAIAMQVKAGLTEGGGEFTVKEYKDALRGELSKADLAALAKQFGKNVLQQVQAGMREQTPTARQEAAAAAREIIQAANDAVVSAKSAFSSAFSGVISAALAAFDATVSGWKPPAILELEAINLQEQKNALIAAMNKAAEEVRIAREELAKKAADPGTSKEDLEAAKQRVIDAEQQLANAEMAQYKAGLEERAKAEQKEHDDKVAADKQRLEDRLKAIEAKYLAEKDLSKGEIAKMNKEIQAALAEAGVDSEKSGQTISLSLSLGIKSAIGEVTKAVNELAKVLKKRLKLKSNAEEGELSDIESWWTDMGPMLAKQIDPAHVKAAADAVGQTMKTGLVTPTEEVIDVYDELGRKTKEELIEKFRLLDEQAKKTGEGIDTNLTPDMQVLRDAIDASKENTEELLERLTDLDGKKSKAEAHVDFFETHFVRTVPWVGASEGEGGFQGGFGKFPGLAEGGIVRKKQLAWVAERGPEMIVPLDRTVSMAGMGTTEINVYVEGSVISERDLADVVRREFLRTQSRNGTLNFT